MRYATPAHKKLDHEGHEEHEGKARSAASREGKPQAQQG